jgi:hypothetical protein
VAKRWLLDHAWIVSFLEEMGTGTQMNLSRISSDESLANAPPSRKTPFRWSAIVVVFTAGMVAALALNWLVPLLIAPKIVIARNLIDFGPVSESKTVSQKITIRNDGFGALRIDKVLASCGCTEAKIGKNVLAWHEETTLCVTVTGRLTPIAAKVVLFTNDPRSVKEAIAVVAMAATRVAASATHLDFQPSSENLRQTKRVFLTFPDRELFLQTSTVNVVLNSPYFDTAVARDGGSASYAISVSLRDSIPKGTTRTTLKLSDPGAQFTIKIPVTVDIPSKYWLPVKPVILWLPNRQGADGSADVVIRKRGAAPEGSKLSVALMGGLEDLVQHQIMRPANAGDVLLRLRLANGRKKAGASVRDGFILVSVRPSTLGGEEIFSVPVFILKASSESGQSTAMSHF